MSATMKVVQGKPQGSFLVFPDGDFVIGRGPECHVRPNSELISQQHCLLRVRFGVIVLRDLASTNGTLVNGIRMRDECVLDAGDTIQVGPLVLQLGFDPAPIRPRLYYDAVATDAQEFDPEIVRLRWSSLDPAVPKPR